MMVRSGPSGMAFEGRGPLSLLHTTPDPWIRHLNSIARPNIPTSVRIEGGRCVEEPEFTITSATASAVPPAFVATQAYRPASVVSIERN